MPLKFKKWDLDEGRKFLIALVAIPSLLIAGFYGFSQRQILATRSSVDLLFPLNAPLRLDEGKKKKLINQDALDSIQALDKPEQSLITIHREVLGSDPFGPCLAKISIKCGQDVYRFLVYFYDGKCERLERLERLESDLSSFCLPRSMLALACLRTT